MSILNGAAGALVCEEARMTKGEYKTINDPLQRQLERLDIAASEKVGMYSDPVLLFMGLAIWSSRLFRLQKEKKEDAHEEQQKSEAVPEKEKKEAPRKVDIKPEDESQPTAHELPKAIRSMIDDSKAHGMGEGQ
jgi:flagellar biosynthesis/type III secretory pathway M-ring protein FliF/YscJ